MEDYYNYRFSGIGRLYGMDALTKIRKSHVLVVGLGGVGSWVVEALARSGVGELTLIDFDDICTSNFNRQIHGLDLNIGKLKSEVLKERILQINEQCKVNIYDEAYGPENEDKIFSSDYSYAIDAIDTSLLKEQFIVACQQRTLGLTVVGATGGRKDPTLIRVDDLSQTSEDSMLYIMRRNLRRNHGFPSGKQKFNIPTVYSLEKPIFPTKDGETSLEKPKNYLKPLDCQNGMGAATFLTGTVAFHAVSTALDFIVK